MVCQSLGLQTGSESPDYIQLWNGSAKLPRESLEVVQRTASVIRDAIAPKLEAEPGTPSHRRNPQPSRLSNTNGFHPLQDLRSLSRW